ncbi:MAG TPA: hypothetical protein VJV23_16470 [Candidatus Polarisedimenticolia bacterium]|nr:hypothetical protein [Candidatus Polarisedimenticolia bacterium]
MRNRLALLPALLLLASAPVVRAVAPAEPPPEEGSFSPLFERRLEVGLLGLDPPPDRTYVASLQIHNRPLETPVSGNPASFCVGSGCLGSFCAGSLCLISNCAGSLCLNSKCAGSACGTSLCGGSVCGTSACLGSVCGGSACLGSACAGCAAGLEEEGA